MILASSRPPVVTASNPAPFTNRPMPQMPQNIPAEDDVEFGPTACERDQRSGPRCSPGVAVMPQPTMPGVPQQPTMPGMPPQQMQPGQQGQQPAQVPMTAPRPGMLPAPATNGPVGPPNPYLGTPPGPAAPTFNPNRPRRRRPRAARVGRAECRGRRICADAQRVADPVSDCLKARPCLAIRVLRGIEAGLAGTAFERTADTPGLESNVMSGSRPAVRGGEYAARGDYHRSPDPSWDYYPTYIAKTRGGAALARAHLLLARASSTPAAVRASSSTSSPSRLAIEGLDQHYSSERVRAGSLTWRFPTRTAASIARSAWTCSST